MKRFEIGQNVVALTTAKSGKQIRIKGNVYTVNKACYCSGCGRQFINTGCTRQYNGTPSWGISECKTETFLDNDNVHLFSPSDAYCEISQDELEVHENNENYEICKIISDELKINHQEAC